MSGIKVNGADYVTFTYGEGTLNDNPTEEVTSTNANGDVYKLIQAKDGSFVKAYFNDQLQCEQEYNADGSLKKERDGITGQTITYAYDAVGHIKNYTSERLSSVKYSASYEYGEMGEVKKITYNDGDGTYENSGTVYCELVDGEPVSRTTLVVAKDWFGRLTSKTIYEGVSEESMSKVEEMEVWYKAQNSNTSSLPVSVKYTRPGGVQNIAYAYDGLHNITSIADGSNTTTYEYDKLTRLVKEVNPHFGTCEYAYDQNGNITSKKVNGTTYSYAYSGNKLMSFNGESCEYDNIGNPIKYRGNSLSWKGRQLSYFNDHHFSYEGTTGRRCRKNSIAFTYDENGNLVKQSDGIKYFYNTYGIAGIIKGGVKYHYSKDVQGNIIAILDSTGKVVVQYWYDAWGNHKVVDANGNEITDQNHIGNVNPFRYRGYYFDVETGLYYLQTRYYDPTTGRFLNRDSIAYADLETINGLNLYAYCLNNPVLYVDPSGHFAITTFLISLAIGTLISWGLSEIFGSQIAGGISSTVSGGAAIYTGIGLLSFGPIGWIIGGALILIGAGTIAFGVNEIVAGATGTNYIQSWTGMSDGLYNGLYIGLNIASDIGTIAGNMYMKYNPRYPGNNPNRIPDGFNDRVNPKANYYNPKTGQSLYPDLQHPAPINPHWDWKDSNGVWWRLYRFFRKRK